MKYWGIALLLIVCNSSFSMSEFSQDVEAYLQASQELEIRIKQGPGMPRLSDPKVAELIATLSDNSRFLSEKSDQLRDLSSVTKMCDKSISAVMSYALFDSNRGFNLKVNPTIVATQVQKVMEQNTLTFQDELGQLTPFLVRCFSKQMPLLSEFVLSLGPEKFTDVRLSGLRKARNGALGIYLGVLRNVNNGSLRKSNRIAHVNSISDTAQQYSSLLRPEQRQEILLFVKSIQADASEEFRPYIEIIAAAMAKTECNALCRL